MTSELDPAAYSDKPGITQEQLQAIQQAVLTGNTGVLSPEELSFLSNNPDMFTAPVKGDNNAA